MKLREYPFSIIKYFELNLLPRENPTAVKVPCIISLTSIETRIRTLHWVIKSLLSQSYRPKKIILWLHYDLEKKLPQNLLRLEGDVFQIRFRGQSCSHRKLVFVLKEFSDEVIVTCDDDIMYDRNWLQSLYESHMKYPRDIIAQECRMISIKKNKLLAYREWPYVESANLSLPNLLAIGYGGVLYPVGVMHTDTTREELYKRLAPKADDLWFKAMSLINGVKVRRALNPVKKPIPIIGAKGNSLAVTNVEQDYNRTQWQSICNHYDINLDCT
jgi:hypothetical protein